MAGLKLTPIILKEVNRYLTSPKKVRKFGFDQPPVKTGKDIKRPENPFREFEERNPQADGGRIGFKDGPRKIYKVARPITDLDRKNNPDIPKDAKFKMQVPAGKFRGSDSSTMMIYDENKSNLNKRLKDIESNVYVKPSKPRAATSSA